jgi:hypothetical protein
VLRANGAVLSFADGSLKFDAPPAPISGSDPIFGPFTGFSVSWNGGIFETSFRVFPALDTIIFSQVFPRGLAGMSGGDTNGLSSAFPVFGPARGQLADNATGFVTWTGGMCTGVTGTWEATGGVTSIGGGHGGPIVLFNASNAALAMSPLSSLMTSHFSFANITKESLGSGLGGMVNDVPAGWTMETVLVSSNSITRAMLALGDRLLARGGKTRTAPDADVAISTLGAWTDNGAYYYYNSINNSQPGAMQATVVEVIAYWAKLGLPLRHLMYDSWWYWKECKGTENSWLLCKGAVELWEPRDDVFPSGFNFQPPGLPLVLHNRWFSANNNSYIKDLGFAGSFISETDVDFALPIKSDVFSYLMGKAKAWGMTVYEQDWLITVWDTMSVTKTNVTAASSWLAAMGDAAASLGLTIQYCMPLPRHMLESTKHQAVTNARASGDYHPDNNDYDIGLSSLFYWSIGVAPSKDDYWTTEFQPGNPYGDKPTEPNWQLEAITVALSTGPNGPSDGIGFTNATLVMSTVNAAGLTLQPDRPATTNDRAFLNSLAPAARRRGAASAPIVERLSTTHTTYGNASWHYILAVDLHDGVELFLGDLGSLGAATRTVALFDYFYPSAAAAILRDATPATSFTVPKGQGQPSAPAAAKAIRYWIAVPQLPGGWFLLGEAGKIVPMRCVQTPRGNCGGGGLFILPHPRLSIPTLSSANNASPRSPSFRMASPQVSPSLRMRSSRCSSRVMMA